jgi:hypothetical protein
VTPSRRWALDPDQRLADPAWRRRHGWSVLIAVCTLGIGTAVWFALVSWRPGISERYKFWAWFWGVFTAFSYTFLGPAFFVPTADVDVSAGAVVIVWLLRLLSVVQAVVMNRVLLRARAVAEVQREAALMAAGMAAHRARPTAPRPFTPYHAPSAPPPVPDGGRVLDPGPFPSPTMRPDVPPTLSWGPAPPDAAPGRRLEL